MGNKRDVLKYELGLERELGEVLRFPSDVRVLNAAPLAFRFNVIKEGILLFSEFRLRLLATGVLSGEGGPLSICSKMSVLHVGAYPEISRAYHQQACDARK